ncbi:hypothetical protein F7725_000500 [Dissostichus mawsoni]|uniref:Gfo/Idh/MocA-like oxidoreductase N-terminal domain-containing protein n=1 Tax=Dissostichus mawsoni TaxID=36200 RepID=A0A7J5ZEK1_DISMA|nr:hypothetical protein F7725_000500 [Dissostichus mawsoni]
MLQTGVDWIKLGLFTGCQNDFPSPSHRGGSWLSRRDLLQFWIHPPERLKEPAVAFAKKGYHVLLEKPMATTAEDCTAIVEACTQSGVMLSVGHVLRYDPVIHNIKELIDAGAIGDVMHIQHLEPPAGAGNRCLDCSIEADCPYSARKIYMDRVKQVSTPLLPPTHYISLPHGNTGWPVSVICPNSFPDIESVTEALETGPYGRCVYECDNDVCSNQVVNMEFEGGLTAAFSMVAFTEEICKRKTTIYGSKGELSCDGQEVRVFDFLTQRSTKHSPLSGAPRRFMSMSGHGGADYYLMDAFVSAVANNDPSLIRSGPEETLMSHMLVFEAERSRLEGRVVYCGDLGHR